MVGLQNPANHILPYKLSPLAAAHVFFSRAPFVRLFETHKPPAIKSSDCAPKESISIADMALNEASRNTVMTGPASDVPGDGTGITPFSYPRIELNWLIACRNHSARFMAITVQGCSSQQIQQGTAMDQDHQRDRRWNGEVLKSEQSLSILYKE